MERKRTFEQSRIIKEDWERKHLMLQKEVGVRITVSEDLEKFIFIGITNRTATGAVATVLGRAPTEPLTTRHIQPVKAIARRIMQEREGIQPSTELQFLKDNMDIGSGVQIVKETIGPNVENPAEWMPALDMFLERGVPPEKTIFVPTFRTPLDVFASWQRMWNWDLENFPFTAFNASFRLTEKMIQQCQSQNIQVVPYVHELIRDHGSTTVVKKMFEIMGLPFADHVVDWSQDRFPPYFSQEFGFLVKYDVPPDKFVESTLEKEKGGREGLVFRPINRNFSTSEMLIIQEQIMPSQAIYDRFKTSTEELLSLKIRRGGSNDRIG